jgi:HrpA-like RNA helicase
MLRVGIEDLVLQVLVLDLGEPSTFLGKALNPPTDLAMSNSLKLLETLGAVECQWAQTSARRTSNANEMGSHDTRGELRVSSELTALGYHLATLPVDPRVGKLMIYGSLLGCVDPALTIAASMSSRSPFVSPFDQRDAADEARKKFAVEGSDHLTILNAFGQWKELKNKKKGNRGVSAFLKENFLGRLTLHQMEDLRNQFAKLLRDIGFLPSSFQLKNTTQTGANANSQNTGLIKAVLCAGLYPNILTAPRSLVSKPGIAKKKGDKKVGECAFQSHRKGEVYLHPSTIAFAQSELDSRYCCYHEIVKTSKTYARDTTTVSPFALLLFGGKLKVYQTHGVCTVDEWLKFRLDAKPATLVKYLRGQMERILLLKIVNPPQDEAVESAEGRALIESISIRFSSKETLPVPLLEPDRSGGEIVRPWTGSDEPDAQNRNSQAGNGGGRRGGRGRGGGRAGRR